jgi:hypothetical protein
MLGPQVVYPQLFRPGSLGGGFLMEEEDVCPDALSAEDCLSAGAAACASRNF